MGLKEVYPELAEVFHLAIKSDQNGIESFPWWVRWLHRGRQIKSDQNGIESWSNTVSEPAYEREIKSDQNGIESPTCQLCSRRCTHDKIRPKWDWKALAVLLDWLSKLSDKIRPKWDWKLFYCLLCSNCYMIKSDQNGIESWRSNRQLSLVSLR